MAPLKRFYASFSKLHHAYVVRDRLYPNRAGRHFPVAGTAYPNRVFVERETARMNSKPGYLARYYGL